MFVENVEDDDYFFLEEAIYDRLHDEEHRGLLDDDESAEMRGISCRTSI